MAGFSERLGDLMFESKITAKQLAARIGVDATTVCRWRRDAHTATLSSLLALAEVFHCSLAFLAGRTDAKLDYTPLPCPPFYISFRAALKAHGITRYRFIKETKFKDPYFTKWKNGADPLLHTLLEISDYLCCTVDSLVGRER